MGEYARDVLLALLTLCIIVGGVVNAAKGLVIWLLLGLVTAGLSWPLTAFLLATPDSLWARNLYSREKRDRAELKYRPRRRRTQA